MAELLFELGLEEIPARMIAGAEAELARRIGDLLTREQLLPPAAPVESFSTPRRLAVRIPGLRPRQQDTEEQLTGPASRIAFKDGAPTPAAHAFAKKAGVAVEALTRIETPKGEYVSATVARTGRTAAEVLLATLPAELSALYWAKNMHWRPGKPERFVRPVRWLLALLDDAVVPVEFGGKTAGAVTYGHRVLHGDAPVPVAHPAQYLETLHAAFVLPEVAGRRHRIRKELDRVTRTVPGARWREDEPLVETVTQLTEWPSVLMGGFEPAFLALPEEVLVTVMRDHQKYFAVEDAGGTLLPHFLAVLNTALDDAGGATVRHGNERVLRARFSDARFFWDFDQRIPLTGRTGLLETVTFQKDLGSYGEKTRKVLALAASLAHTVSARGVSLDPAAVVAAARLAKTDLTTELVKEFTELQGVVGGLYARAQGVSAAAAEAIYWQYRPASSTDRIPPTVEGQLLGLADRTNSIVDMFALGLEPTGSKDPFALRRAGTGVIKILAEGELPLTLSELEHLATSPAQDALAETATEAVRGFLRERLEFYLRDLRAFAYDVVNATLAAGDDDVRDAIARAEAVAAVRHSADFAAIAVAFKRIANILRQAAEKGEALGEGVAEALLREPAEQRLFREADALAPQVHELSRERLYAPALRAIARLRPAVDAFFDTVMVMAPEPELRRNRLTLIAEILRGFSGIAHFSEIVVP